MKKVVVDIYSAKNRNVGVGEYSYRLGEALAQRADAFAKENVKLIFLLHQALMTFIKFFLKKLML